MTGLASMVGGSNDWFVRREGQVRGPFTSARVRHYVLEGRLQMADEVSCDRVTWQILSNVPEVVPMQFRRGGNVDAAALARFERRERMRAWTGILVAMTLIFIAVGVSLWLGNGRVTTVVNCGSPAAPGVKWGSCQFDGVELASVDLQGADLSNASMINANLADVRLSGADLGYVNLAGADLSYASLDGARLLGAKLRDANLANADLSNANMAHADLTGALLGGAKLVSARLDGAIWTDGRRCRVPSLGVCR